MHLNLEGLNNMPLNNYMLTSQNFFIIFKFSTNHLYPNYRLSIKKHITFTNSNELNEYTIYTLNIKILMAYTKPFHLFTYFNIITTN